MRALDEQAGESISSGGIKPIREGLTFIFGKKDNREFFNYGDSGPASRFFYTADWNHEAAERLAESEAVKYQAKAGRRERDSGLTSGNLLPNAGKRTLSGGKDTRGRPAAIVYNPHPTVKSISLNRWLASLLLPPAVYARRRLLVPFAGVGSEMVGAALAGWDQIVGVEGEREYVDIGRARLRWWLLQGAPLETLAEIESDDEPRQLRIF